jgi:hypothetical protein
MTVKVTQIHTGLGTKNDYAGEDQQQLTQPEVIMSNAEAG